MELAQNVLRDHETGEEVTLNHFERDVIAQVQEINQLHKNIAWPYDDNRPRQFLWELKNRELVVTYYNHLNSVAEKEGRVVRIPGRLNDVALWLQAYKSALEVIRASARSCSNRL